MIATSERPPDEGGRQRLHHPGLVVRRWGSGPEVVLVHGSVTGAHASWAELRRGAHGWTLVAPNRRGYHPRTPASREDFRADAADIAQLCRRPVHLVGHSYGAIVALLAAAGHIPALVVSGGHSVVFEAAADDIAERIAGVRRVIAGAGHFVQRHSGFARLLIGFLRAHEPEPACRTGDSLSNSS